MEHEFRGTSLTITYDDEVCIHAAECVRGLPSLFDPDQKRPGDDTVSRVRFVEDHRDTYEVKRCAGRVLPLRLLRLAAGPPAVRA